MTAQHCRSQSTTSLGPARRSGAGADDHAPCPQINMLPLESSPKMYRVPLVHDPPCDMFCATFGTQDALLQDYADALGDPDALQCTGRGRWLYAQAPDSAGEPGVSV